MAITFRGTKGSPLTHTELDQNFREFYYSSSYLGTPTNPYAIKFFTSSSLDSGSTVFLPTAVGNQYNIQVKSGSNNISSSFFTSSDNFQYNFATNHLSVSGSGEYSGNLIVSGTLIANQYETVIVSSSIKFTSGSTNSGNTADDIHKFTGSLRVNGSMTGSLLSTNGIISGSSQIASDISGSTGALSQSIEATLDLKAFKSTISGAFAAPSASIATNINTNTANISSNDTEIASLTAATSSYLQNTTDTLTGNLTVTGTLTAQEFVNELVSSSVIYESGSTKFGDDTGDRHDFTGSLNVSGSSNIVGNLAITGFANVSQSLASAVAGAGIQNLVEDTTPQLGGKLHLNGQHLSGSIIHSGSTHLSGSVTASGVMFVDGLISASGDIIAFASSDERLKDNITPIDGALDKINQIDGYEFDWNNNSEHSGHDVGVIAQEIEKVLPELVVDRKDGYKAVRYEKIVALLISAIKEQQLQIDLLLSKD